jgi:hypothetical protein
MELILYAIFYALNNAVMSHYSFCPIHLEPIPL